MAVPVPVAAQPSPEASGAATAADQQPGTTVCDITADGLQEISGLVAIDGGFFAIPDDGDTVDVFQLDSACEVVAEFSFDNDPRDTEDLAMAADGALWIADTGDNAAAEEDFDDARETVALWRITPDRSDIAIYRFTYPDQPHDAEALIVEPDGTPVIITKEVDGTSGIYIPDGELVEGDPIPLTLVGEVTFEATGTEGNLLGLVGQRLATGAALSPDGTRVLIRTYSDAYEWDVTNGDVVGALTNGTPRITPLPEEPQGEAITYSHDGRTFYTATEAVNNEPARIYQYTPTAPPPPTPATSDAGTEMSWFDRLQFQDITRMIAGVGVFGLLLLLIGILGIWLARRRARDRAAGAKKSDDDEPDWTPRDPDDPDDVRELDGGDPDEPDGPDAPASGEPVGRAKVPPPAEPAPPGPVPVTQRGRATVPPPSGSTGRATVPQGRATPPASSGPVPVRNPATGAVGRVSGRAPRSTGANPQVSGANPRVTGANSQVSGANPRVTGANPRVTGANPRVTGANPRVTGANSQVSGANPRVTGANPVIGSARPPAGTDAPVPSAGRASVPPSPTPSPRRRLGQTAVPPGRASVPPRREPSDMERDVNPPEQGDEYPRRPNFRRRPHPPHDPR